MKHHETQKLDSNLAELELVNSFCCVLVPAASGVTYSGCRRGTCCSPCVFTWLLKFSSRFSKSPIFFTCCASAPGQIFLSDWSSAARGDCRGRCSLCSLLLSTRSIFIDMVFKELLKLRCSATPVGDILSSPRLGSKGRVFAMAFVWNANILSLFPRRR